MPTIRYERNMRGSVMRIEANGSSSYDEVLLLHNRIPGILPMEKSMLDENWQYWYNITGKQSFDTVCEWKGLSVSLLRNMVLALCRELEILDKYLVSENCLLLEKTVIFLEEEDHFVFTPYPMEGKPLQEQFRSLMEELIAMIDHKDQELVELAYGLYAAAQKENYSIEELQKLAMQQSANTKKGLEKPSPGFAAEAEDPLRAIPAGMVREQSSYRASPPKEEGGLRGWFRNVIEYVKEEWSDEAGEEMEEAVHEEKMYREFYVTPDSLEETEKPKRANYQPSPTVCLKDYQNHPEGLLLYEGNENYKTVRLQKDTTIGQSREAVVYLDRETISYLHARIVCREEEYYLEDLNSTNGTFVNNRPLTYKEEVQLKVNDIIRFADLKYRFI